MAKDDREAKLKSGRQLLKQWEVAADAEVAVLGELLGREPAADLAIIERLGLADGAAVPLLLRIEAQSSDKLLKREARRSLYRLEQRGIETPKREAEPALAIPLASPIEGSMSPVDGRGDQLVWLEKRTGNGSDFVFAVINDPEGLKDLDFFHASRKEVRFAQEKMLEENEVRLVPVEWHHCDALIERARKRAEARGQKVADYTRIRAQFSDQPAVEREHPVFARIPRALIDSEPQWLPQATLLVTEPEFRTWFFTRDQLQTYIDEFQQIRDSPLVLNRPQQMERLNDLVLRAVEEIFNGEVQASWSRRLMEMAYFFDSTKRHAQAKSALATAMALEASTTGGRGIPLCEALVRGSLMAHFQMTEKEEQETTRSSLVLTPGQVMRESEQKRPR